MLFSDSSLSISAALCFFVLRRRSRWYLPASLLGLTIEVFTSVVWIQLTGTVSSYFLIVVPILILAYRLYAAYWLGLVVYVVGAAMHARADDDNNGRHGQPHEH